MDISRLLNRLPGINPVEQMQLKNVLSESTETRSGDTVNNSRQEQASGGEQHVPGSSHQASRENIVWQDMQGRRQAEQSYGIAPNETARLRPIAEGIPENRVIQRELAELLNNTPSASKKYQKIRQINQEQNKNWSDRNMQLAAGIGSNMARRLRNIEKGSPGSQLIKQELAELLNNTPSASKKYQKIRQINQEQNKNWSDRNMKLAAGIFASEAAIIRHSEEGSPGSQLIKQELAELLNSISSASEKYRKIRQINQEQQRNWSDRDMQLAAGIHSSIASIIRQSDEGSPGSTEIKRELADLLNNKISAADKYRKIRQINQEQQKNWSEKDMRLAAGIAPNEAARLRDKEEGSPGSLVIKYELADLLNNKISAADKYRKIRQINQEQQKNWSEKDIRLAAGIAPNEASRLRNIAEGSLGSRLIKRELAELLPGITSVSEKYRRIRQINQEQHKNWSDRDMQLAAGIHASVAAKIRQSEKGSPVSRLIKRELADLLNNITPATDKYRKIRQINQEQHKNWSDRDMQLAAGIQTDAAARIRRREEGSPASLAIRHELAESLNNIKSLSDKYRKIRQINQEQHKNWSDKDMQQAAGIQNDAAAAIRQIEKASPGSLAIRHELAELLNNIKSLSKKYREIRQINQNQHKNWSDKDMQLAAGIHPSVAARIRHSESKVSRAGQ